MADALPLLRRYCGEKATEPQPDERDLLDMHVLPHPIDRDMNVPERGSEAPGIRSDTGQFAVPV